MKVFISWSGERSKAVALALRQWLPDVIQSIEPWVSAEDIEAGTRWGSHVTSELSVTSFGIICLTRDNQIAPWILFEAGALAKTIENTFVVPYLIDIEPADIQRGPLNQFQAKRANKTETWELVRTLNRRLESSLPESQIERTFEKWQPDLEKSLKDIPNPSSEAQEKRHPNDMIEEILELVRGMTRTASVSQVVEEPQALVLSSLIDDSYDILSEKERIALRLRYISRLSYKDISSILGVSQNSLRLLIHRAHRKLEDSLEKMHQMIR